MGDWVHRDKKPLQEGKRPRRKGSEFSLDWQRYAAWWLQNLYCRIPIFKLQFISNVTSVFWLKIHFIKLSKEGEMKDRSASGRSGRRLPSRGPRGLHRTRRWTPHSSPQTPPTHPCSLLGRDQLPATYPMLQFFFILLLKIFCFGPLWGFTCSIFIQFTKIINKFMELREK